MTLEENVLAYLDGSLGDAESAELLHTLSASPDKRAVLEEHLRLRDMLTLGRKPFAVPLEAEQQLAARVPILGTPARTLPFFTRAFYTKPLVLATSAAAVLAVVGGLWWNATRINETNPNEAPVTFNNTSNAPNAVALNAVAPNAGVSSVGVSSAAVPSAAVGATSHRIVVNDAPHNSAPSNAFIARNTKSIAKSSSTSNLNADRVSQPVGGATNPEHLTERAVPAPIATSPEDENAPTLHEAQLAASAIPHPTVSSPRTLHEIAFGKPERQRPLSVGASSKMSQYYFPAMNGIEAAFGVDPQLTVDYDVTQWIALGVEAGQTTFGQLRTVYSASSQDATSYTRLKAESLVAHDQTLYARGSVHFTFDAASEYPIRIGGSIGAAFEQNGTAPCGAVSAGIARTVADNLTFDLEFVATSVWSSATPGVIPDGNGVTGITYAQTNAQSNYTTVFGVRTGIRYRP